jgi:NAD(P)-dependent dehydrogenase (short-subunit alcohol dehydrogenase family)
MEQSLETWTSENLSLQKSNTVLVTRAKSGIGFYTALALAKMEATVVVAGRNPAKVEKAVADIRAEGIEGCVEPAIVDLASLASVRFFSSKFLEDYSRINMLINNASVMMPPAAKTQDGFESQFGVNFIGHFALTGLLYETLTKTGILPKQIGRYHVHLGPRPQCAGQRPIGQVCGLPSGLHSNRNETPHRHEHAEGAHVN